MSSSEELNHLMDRLTMQTILHRNTRAILEYYAGGAAAPALPPAPFHPNARYHQPAGVELAPVAVHPPRPPDVAGIPPVHLPGAGASAAAAVAPARVLPVVVGPVVPGPLVDQPPPYVPPERRPAVLPAPAPIVLAPRAPQPPQALRGAAISATCCAQTQTRARCRNESSEVEAVGSSSRSPSAAPLPLNDAIRQYVDELWLRHSIRDGRAVCEELYKGWLLFLSRQRLSHLIRIDLKTWQAAVETLLQLPLLSMPIAEDGQAMLLPADCRVLRTRKVFRLQWEMVMTSMCSPDVCVAVWERRRRTAARQSVRSRQLSIADEMQARLLLKERFPQWTDDWTPPILLTEEELKEAAEQEVQALDLHDLERLIENEPDNTAAKRELRMRKKGL